MPRMPSEYLDGSEALTTKDEVRGKGNLDMMCVHDKGIAQVNMEWKNDQRHVPHTAGPAPKSPYQNIDQKIDVDKADVENNRVQTERAFNENAGEVIHTQFNDPNRNTMGPLLGANAPKMSQTADAVGRSIESTVAGVENRVELVKNAIGEFFGLMHDKPSQSHSGQPNATQQLHDGRGIPTQHRIVSRNKSYTYRSNQPGRKQAASRGEEGAGKKKEGMSTPQ